MTEETLDAKPSVKKAFEEFTELEDKLKQVSYTLTKLKEKFIEHVFVYFPLESKRKLKTATYGISIAQRFNSKLYIYFEPELMQREPKFMQSVIPRLKRLADNLEVDVSISQKNFDELMDIELENIFFLVPNDVGLNQKMLPRPLVLV